MIKLKNQGETILELGTSGAQSATAHAVNTTSSAVVPFAGRLKAILARQGVAGGVTGSQIVDVFVNGVSIATALLTFTNANGTKPVYNTAAFATNPPLFNQGDVITLKNTAVQTAAADDLCVYLTVERQRAGSYNSAVQTDTVGNDSDQI